MNVLSNIVIALLILFVVITPYILRFVEQALPEKQRAALDQFVKYAVQSVEQEFSHMTLAQKRSRAEQIVVDLFEAIKLPIPAMALIDAAIGSFFYELGQASQPPEPEPALPTGPVPIVPPQTQINA